MHRIIDRALASRCLRVREQVTWGRAATTMTTTTRTTTIQLEMLCGCDTDDSDLGSVRRNVTCCVCAFSFVRSDRLSVPVSATTSLAAGLRMRFSSPPVGCCHATCPSFSSPFPFPFPSSTSSSSTTSLPLPCPSCAPSCDHTHHQSPAAPAPIKQPAAGHRHAYRHPPPSLLHHSAQHSTEHHGAETTSLALASP